MRNILSESKIAIVYRGHYYRSGWKPSNLFNCIDNHVECIHSILPYKDIYLHTYTGPEDDKLLELLKPNRYQIEPHPPHRAVAKQVEHNRVQGHESRVNTFVKANALFDVGQYDYILNLRFDLNICIPIHSWPLHFDKFNTLHPEADWQDWNEEKKTSDLMYFYPKSLHNAFVQCTNELFDLENHTRRKRRGYNRFRTRPIGWMHWVVKHLIPVIGMESINLMYPMPYWSGSQPSDWKKNRPHNPAMYINRG